MLTKSKQCLARTVLAKHKEYANAYPTTFVITKTAVVAENANIPNGKAPISFDKFKPFPKNPTIAKFFMQLGRFDELGTGVLNINNYIKAYSGQDNPQFIEGHPLVILKHGILISKSLLRMILIRDFVNLRDFFN